MRMRDFIKENRKKLDEAIHHQVRNISLTDKDRQDWILNDESLYNWARRESVKI